MHDDDVMIGALACDEGIPILFAGDCGDSSDRNMKLEGLWKKQWKEGSKVEGKTIPRTCMAIREVSKYFARAREASNDSCGALWERVGKAYVLTCAKYETRRSRIIGELSRVGLFAEEICDDLTDSPELPASAWGFDRCSLAHQKAIEKFLAEEGDRCAIIEDDARFLCNSDIIKMSLLSIPDDFGALQFGWMPRFDFRKRSFAGFGGSLRDDFRSGKMWGKFKDASSNTFTVVTRKVAETWLKKLKSKEKDKNDNLLCDACIEAGMPMYASNPEICIQFDEGEGGTNTGRFFRDRERGGKNNPQLIPSSESYMK